MFILSRFTKDRRKSKKQVRRSRPVWLRDAQDEKEGVPEGMVAGHHPGCGCDECQEATQNFMEENKDEIRRKHNEILDKAGYTAQEKDIYWICVDSGIRPPMSAVQAKAKHGLLEANLPPVLPPGWDKVDKEGFVVKWNEMMDKRGYTDIEKQIFWMCIEAGIRPPAMPLNGRFWTPDGPKQIWYLFSREIQEPNYGDRGYLKASEDEVQRNELVSDRTKANALL